MSCEAYDCLDIVIVGCFEFCACLFEFVESFEQFRADGDVVTLEVSGFNDLFDQFVELLLVFYFRLAIACSREHVL